MSGLVTRILKRVIAMAPTVVAMWALFTMEQNGTWPPEMPYRDVLTIAVLGAALALSFVLYSWLRPWES
ncbi:hypothetical protein BST95_01855 [Halioglobus japonicus]|uniref:Uncharacterized protein n=1 Tax=Halioglobus japonicus TaxID=930805 RepID=A0AAP8MCE8_9GAMM|nr:hypothetical protein [Halioglobus japonicus]AQA17146.1 hypothetical protein BST95_01855 [Halioglobus japonicus]PLW85059.1 hypothetical protein C0029_16120 [Halioglobus japonicus]GHD19251.1 hypothetical protein GCM10007052_27480 [Halioglobus japonicus]